MTMSASELPADEPPAKAIQIIEGARSAFIELGFEGASMDEIARRAGVSKPTLYHHFQDKRGVFEAFVRRDCARHAGQVFDVDLATPGIDAALRTIGRRILDLALSPFGRGMLRVVTSESQRFPELGRIFYACGPELGNRRLSVLMAAAVGRGELRIDDVELAAWQFLGLCDARLFWWRVLETEGEPPAAERQRYVDAAVDVFMKAYRA